MFLLGRIATVFQSEVFVIVVFTHENFRRRYVNQSMNICTDSQAAVRAVATPFTTSHLIIECQRSLAALTQKNWMTFIWIRRHFSVECNERVDDLVRREAINLSSD